MSLVERMVDKGALTLSIDKALWAVAAMIAAFNAPVSFEALLQFAQHLD